MISRNPVCAALLFAAISLVGQWLRQGWLAGTPAPRPRSRSYKLLRPPLFPAHATPEHHSLHAVTARSPDFDDHLPFHLEPLLQFTPWNRLARDNRTSHSFHHP